MPWMPLTTKFDFGWFGDHVPKLKSCLRRYWKLVMLRWAGWGPNQPNMSLEMVWWWFQAVLAITFLTCNVLTDVNKFISWMCKGEILSNFDKRWKACLIDSGGLRWSIGLWQVLESKLIQMFYWHRSKVGDPVNGIEQKQHLMVVCYLLDYIVEHI